MTELYITHTLSFHQSAFSEASDTAQIPDGAILGEWLAENVKGFDAENKDIAYSIPLDMPVHSDVAAVYAPKATGAAIAGWIALAVSAASVAYLIATAPGKPKTPKAGDQGRAIDGADAQANVAKYGQPVREIFGRYKVFPDYLVPPRTLYVDGRVQELRLLLCVGVGEYNISPDDVKIAETRMSELDGVSYQIFNPNSDLSGSLCHENWYDCPEVGSTTNSTGIKLEGSTSDTQSFAGDAMGYTSGEGQSLIRVLGNIDEWVVGAEGTIKLAQPATVSNSGTDPADTIKASFAEILFSDFSQLKIGMDVTVSSSFGLSGDFRVRSLSSNKKEITLETLAGVPVTGIAPASGTITIDKTGTKYRLIFCSAFFSEFEVERILSGGSSDPDWGETSTPNGTFFADIEWNSDIGGRIGRFAVTPEGEITSNIEVDIFAPNGIGTISGSTVSSRSRQVLIEYREIGATRPWTQIAKTVSGATRDQLGFTFPITLPYAMRPEVRVSRIGEEDISLDSLDRLEVTAIRSKLPTKTRYPDFTTMAVTITGLDKIGSSSNNKINVIAERKLNGAPTRHIADAVKYIGRTQQLDDAKLLELDTIWKNRGDEFNFSFENHATIKQALNTALGAGFAEMTVKDGLVTPVRDAKRNPLLRAHSFSAQNTTEPITREISLLDGDETYGFDVEYVSDKTWRTETVECRKAGLTGNKVEKLTIDGVTDRTQAWRIGMRELMRRRYQRQAISTATELDALNANYGDLAAFIEDVPKYGQSALIESINGNVIKLTETIKWQAGNMVAVARDKTGKLQTMVDITRVTDKSFTPATSMGALEPMQTVFIGTRERIIQSGVVVDVKASQKGAKIAAVNYTDRIYDFDDAQADN